MYVRTVFESGIDTLTKGIKFIPALPHPVLEHKPAMLNLIQVGRIGRQIPNLTSGLSYHFLNALGVMETGIVNHDDITRLQLGNQTRLQPLLKQDSVASAPKGHWGKQAILLQGSNPTDTLGTLAGFEGIEALPNLAVAVRILLSVIDTRFIHIHNLADGFAL
jgi:hypothetical protein